MRALLFAGVLLMAAPAAAQPVAIAGAKVWTGTADRPVENATVVIANGRIVSVGQGAAPDGARIIDGRGKVVTLPLHAAATQVGLVEVSGAENTDDRAVDGGPLGAAFEVGLGFDANDLPVQEARAEGVAYAMLHPGAASKSVFSGQGARVRLDAGGAAV